ncbi:hypothetical protein Cni_G11512 [Canna indica]|uniref:Uncharacterized protein n=1 Tax=Canna indica TaxID=4628 RepID=A0AAQ3K677_9LILI|nr:hypothetical protein Cni_G11512 [Canna indica]
MAHQSKFVSVNLNRSYGQPSSSSSSSIHGRSRPGSGGGGGSGGMVVLSRARSSSSSVAKTAQKLAVPPPMNLPSLRKEHERFDPASSTSGAGHGSPALGSRAGPSSLGWSKPALPPTSSVMEKDAGARSQSQLGRPPINGDELAGGAYIPPGSRPGSQPLNAAPTKAFSEKAVILRGEDFPSLRATFTPAPKQKEALGQKQRQKQGIEELLEGPEVVPESHAPIQMRPQIRSSRLITSNVMDGDGRSIRPLSATEKSHKQDSYLPGLLPNVRLQHTSEWTDDERDTGLSIPERERDGGFSRSESVQVHDPFDGRGLHDSKVGSTRSREFFKGDTFGRDVKVANSGGQDFGSWRFPLNPRDRLNTNSFGVDIDKHHGRPLSGGRERNIDGVNVTSSFGNNGNNGFVTRSQDSRYSRMGLSSPENIRNGKVAAETFSGKNAEQNVRGHYNDNSNNWSKGSSFQNITVSKVQFSTGSRGASLSDPILNFGREKRSTSSVAKPYLDDVEFDSRDPFSGGIGDINVKVFKKKKDLEKQVDFPDPIRESFEAELESILRIQEQERQRAMEEQARALEIARKEEEERERLAREEEERRQLLEEEAREAAWRAEQERLEATRRAEELRIAREEEKNRYLMEEERRKEAARKKLLELEARIARRQAEDKGKDDKAPSSVAVSDDLVHGLVMERDDQRVAEVGGWEDGDRMVEQITSSALSDSSSLDRILDVAPRSQFPRDGTSSFLDRGKYSYGGTILPSQSEDNSHQNARQDTFSYRRGFPKKELHGSIGTVYNRPSSKSSTMESSQMPDEYRQPRKQRWNSTKEGDYFRRNTDIDAEIIDNAKFGDVGITPGIPHGSPHAPYSEISSENSIDEFSSFSRNRPFLRQPRVPPPPYVTSLQRSSFRNPTDISNSSRFTDDKAHYSNPSRYEQKSLQTGYDSVFHETVQQCDAITFLEENTVHSEQEPEKMSPKCDSQLSLSALSPPSSPALFAHHEMDVSRDSPPLPTSADGERTVVSDSEHVVLPLEGVTVDRMMTSRSVSSGVDDEWPVDNNEEIQEQEEYYGEGDDYEDIAEAHEADDDNLDAVKEIEDLQSDQVILGFNEGVEVKLPSIDKFEITSSNKNEFRMQPDFSSSVEEPISTEEITLQEGNLDSSIVVSEAEKALQDLTLEPVMTSSYSINNVESSQTSVISSHQTLVSASSLAMASTVSDSPILSLPSTVASQGEAPITLQFGLFSGPSLIPSPVPAIQIGSIQMPIHVHTQINPSLPQVHPSQPPLFQFGQLRYAPTIPQSILPLAPHSTSFVQPPVPASYSYNQNSVGCFCNQASQSYSSQNKLQDEKTCSSSVEQSDLVQNNFESSQEKLLAGQHKSSLDSGKNDVQNQTVMSTMGERKGINNSILQADHGDDHATVKKSYRLIAKRKESQAQQHSELQSSRFFSGGKPPLSVGRRKRYAYSVKNAGSRSPFPELDSLQEDSNGFQRRSRRNVRRTEFGMRENIERKQTQGPESLNYMVHDKKSNENSMTTGISVRNLGKKDATLNRPIKISNEPENSNSGTSYSRVVGSDKKTDKTIGNESALKSMSTFDKSHAGQGNISGNVEEDVDAPLLSGVVRVFKQTGIEVPSNEDDFIEVRSKRQMLNDRREQRAKENKSKSRAPKAPSKQTSVSLSTAANSNSNKAAISSVGSNPNIVSSNPLVGEGKSSPKLDPALVFTASQTLPPIGTPSVNVDPERRLNELKSSQTATLPAVSDSTAMLVPGLLENKNIKSDYSMPSSSWDSVNLNNQVIALTQSQLEEAMKPSQFGSQVANIVLEPHKPVSSVVTAEIPFSSCSSPVNSLLASEKIQFGAVMPPNILPPVSRAISKSFGHSDSSGSELKIGQNLPTNNYSMFFVKEKCPGEPCRNLEDAEAEAAASAVAVAAITNDEMVGAGIGTSSETKSFTSTSRGTTSSQEVAGQSANEESLTVALPADLSVDTALSVWPALPSPQTSEPMLSQFTGTPPSHFPSFEMNRILDGCTFAYGSNDESAGSQGQSQKAAALGSGPPGTWPQYPSGVDSFYRPTAGFTGPFISPGGIPGVQCPPHMVFYNHFAPVGQFGQVGLGFMGTTYIPAGKQPEWKQNQTSSTVGDNNGELSNTNVVSGQGNPTSMPMPNLGPGSPLMAVAPPLTMFDMSPFQPTANIPLQAWSHVPAPLHSIPLSMPLQQPHVESRIPSQFGWNLSGDASSGNNRFGESCLAVSAEISRNIPFPNSSASEISDDLGPVKQPTSSTSNVQTTKSSDSTSSGSEKKVPKTVVRPIGSSVNDSGGIAASNNCVTGQMTALPSKTQQATLSSQQHSHPVGYTDQQGGVSQRTYSRSEWHRRGGFQVRKQSSVADKNIGAPKMKQIYVAKPSSSRPTNQG